MNWQKFASNLLKSELAYRGINYEQLHQMLAAIGVKQSANNIAVKIHRGTFSFIFFLQIMRAIGTKTVTLEK